MKKVLFIDRDGTLILETDDFKIETFEKIKFYPEVMYWLGHIAREMDYELVLVTNQDGLGTDYFPDEPFFTTHRFVMDVLAGEHIHFSAEHIDRSWPDQGLDTRKPGVGMLRDYFGPEYDLSQSFVIGDRVTDVILARNLGCKCFWLNDGRGLGMTEITESADTIRAHTALETRDWRDIYYYLAALRP